MLVFLVSKRLYPLGGDVKHRFFWSKKVSLFDVFKKGRWSRLLRHAAQKQHGTIAFVFVAARNLISLAWRSHTRQASVLPPSLRYFGLFRAVQVSYARHPAHHPAVIPLSLLLRMPYLVKLGDIRPLDLSW